jgi:hypothetical protein
MCYAQNSFDSAIDPAYSNGWQDGDNGGTGFTPWNFDSSYVDPTPPPTTWYEYTNAEFHAIDNGLQAGTQFSNPHNSLGQAWAMGISATNNGVPRAGRGFSQLGIGDTINVVFDNPTRRQGFAGYIIRLNGGTGGENGNICNFDSNYSCTPNEPQPFEQIGLARYEYFNYGEWNLYDSGGKVTTGVYDTGAENAGGTAAAGALFSVTRTGANTYDVLLDPLGAAASFSASRTYEGLPIDWIEFVFFNGGTSDVTPTLAEPGTDLYIRSLEIIRAASPGQPGDYNEDGKVDAADYVAWRKLPGLFGGDPAGYNTWRENFGEGSAGGAAGVPEPTTFVSLITAAGLFLFVAPIRLGARSRNQVMASPKRML